MKNNDTKKSPGRQSQADRVWKRLGKDRPMTAISIRIPEDVIGDLKDIAPALGYSGYQPLIRAYIGCGMSDSMIAEVIEEARVS